MKTSNSLVLDRTGGISDYVLLIKPELTLLSVATALCGAWLALRGTEHYVQLIHTFIGTLLIGGSAGVLNQYMERHYDVLMNRTKHRPLPSKRLRPADALIFGIALGWSGLLYLIIFTNWLSVLLSFLTLIIYLGIYTPLKRKTPHATALGGISGALPPLIGWSIVRGTLTLEAWALFFILLFWQMPHFLSLAWMYRNDYALAGYKVLPVLDTDGRATSLKILVYAIALFVASLIPYFIGSGDIVYFYFALILSIGYILMSIYFFFVRTNKAARKLFLSSLLFLIALFFFLLV